MRTFEMHRKNDETGISGTGKVLEGVEFSNGKVAVSWTGSNRVKAQSVGVYDSMEDFKEIHVNHHPDNRTEIREETL